MKLYFVRHGESIAAKLNMISNRDLPHGLTGQGVLQAKNLAEKLRDIRFRQFYSSPIPRARETSEILSGILGIDFVFNPDLHEIDMGELEGRAGGEALRTESSIYDKWLIDKEHHVSMPGGESFHDVRERFFRFIAGLETLKHATDQNFLVVAHGGLYMCMIPLLCANLGADYNPSLLENCGYIEVIKTGDSYRCVKWGDSDIDE